MIVVVVLGALAALSAPSIIRSIDRNNARGEARAIANIFQTASSLARANGQPVLVTINDAARTINLFHTGNPGVASCSMASAGIPHQDDLIKSYVIGSHYADAVFSHSASNGDVLCFSPTGRLLRANTNRPYISTTLPGGCDGMNLLLWLHRDGVTLSNENHCLLSTDGGKAAQKDKRDMSNFFMIHIPYAGNPEVFQ